MKIRSTAALLALALVAALAPVTASAKKHCVDVFIFQGADAGGGVRRGLNTGYFGCQVDETDDTFDTNIVIPNAQVVYVGVAGAFKPTSGTLKVGNRVTNLTFTLNELQGRYESQSIPAQYATMVATVSNAGGDTETVTYRAL